MTAAARAEVGDRSLFPDLEAFAYLNHAAVSPASRPVRDAVLALVDDYARRGMAAVGAWREQREGLRARLARLIGASPAELALASSTTRAIVDVALCLPWQAGDRIVCFTGEFPTNVTPWQRAAEAFSLELVMLEAASLATEEGLAALDAELAHGARLVALSAVQFQTGLRMPLAEVSRRAHAAGAELFVDGIQAVGVVPLDVHALGVDYLACGSHKWLMGLEGAGFLYVKEDLAPRLVPRVAGWLSHEDALLFLFEGGGHLRYDRPLKQDPTVFEGGAMNGAGFAALDAAASLIEQIGVSTIFAHVQRYHDALEPALVARGFASERAKDPSQRSGILSALPPEAVSLPRLHAALMRRGVSCTMPDGRLRFSPHWPNALAEIPRVVGALDEALAEVRG